MNIQVIIYKISDFVKKYVKRLYNVVKCLLLVMKLDITLGLENLDLDNSDNIAILNLPGAPFCDHGCYGCVYEKIIEEGPDGVLDNDEIIAVIDHFADNYETRFITINGRGDPFHPKVVESTLEKIRYGYKKGIQAYVFTAGDNLDQRVCETLAEHEVNVMMSLFGNKLIDARFFDGREYQGVTGEMASNFRRLIEAYPTEVTRLGMNYVVTEKDIKDPRKVMDLKKAAEANGIYFQCNVPFGNRNQQLRHFATSFGLEHSTFVKGKCQMGAGSSVTVDYDGTLFRCPYQTGNGLGNFFELRETGKLREVLLGLDRSYVCVVRGTKSQ